MVTLQPQSDNTLYCFHIRLNRSAEKVALHRHHSHEFFYCLEGAGVQHTEQGDESFSRGEVFFFPAGQPHIASTPAQQCFAVVVNVMHRPFLSEVGDDPLAGRVLEHLVNRAASGQNRIALSSGAVASMAHHFQRMADEQRRKEPGYDCAVRLALHEVLLGIYRDPAQGDHFTEPDPPDLREARIRDVCRYIDANIGAPMSVAPLAELACMSRSHFHAVFKARTGMTLTAYINSGRIRMARKLLRQTDTPIMQVAMQCGFGNLSHFYHTFKKQLGMTPAEARRQEHQAGSSNSGSSSPEGV